MSDLNSSHAPIDFDSNNKDKKIFVENQGALNKLADEKYCFESRTTNITVCNVTENMTDIHHIYNHTNNTQTQAKKNCILEENN